MKFIALRELKVCRFGEAAISDIGLLEIAMLANMGRIELAVPLARCLHELQTQYPILPISSDVAAEAVDLPLPHADPFDRVIVATARSHGLPLLTRDRKISDSGLVRVIW